VYVSVALSTETLSPAKAETEKYAEGILLAILGLTATKPKPDAPIAASNLEKAVTLCESGAGYRGKQAPLASEAWGEAMAVASLAAHAVILTEPSAFLAKEELIALDAAVTIAPGLRDPDVGGLRPPFFCGLPRLLDF
jgi:hypothetical protein